MLILLRKDTFPRVSFPTRIQICIPLNSVVGWYHRVLVHPGKDQMIKTIAMHFYHPGLRTRVVEFVKQCKTCQEMKINNQKYGELPPREPELVPWGTVAVDLIGLWTINLPNRDISFQALTIIDTVTNFHHHPSSS
jgi:Integrase zinc binding domain